MSLITSLLVCLALATQVDTVRLDYGTYIGEFPSGEGKFYHNERGLYVGYHNRTVITGRGMRFKPDGGKYVGNFVKGLEQGYGRFFMHTGAVICGEFRDGRANGLDTLFYPDGKVFIGIMRNGGATSQGKTYRNANAAGVAKPLFPEYQLDEEDLAFLAEMRVNDYDSPAVFRDGVSFFEVYISPNFRYKESMSGKNAIVHYEFTVGEDGKISDVTITSTTDEAFSKELVRVIMRSPKWTPAMKDGKPVPYTIKNQKVHFGGVE